MQSTATPEQAFRSNRALLPARVNAALGVMGGLARVIPE